VVACISSIDRYIGSYNENYPLKTFWMVCKPGTVYSMEKAKSANCHVGRNFSISSFRALLSGGGVAGWADESIVSIEKHFSLRSLPEQRKSKVSTHE